MVLRAIGARSGPHDNVHNRERGPAASYNTEMSSMSTRRLIQKAAGAVMMMRGYSAALEGFRKS